MHGSLGQVIGCSLYGRDSSVTPEGFKDDSSKVVRTRLLVRRRAKRIDAGADSYLVSVGATSAANAAI